MNQDDPDIEQRLRVYADWTAALLPRVNDTIKIENPDGRRWMVMHLPSREEVRVRQANQWREMRVWAAWIIAVLGVYCVALPFFSHPKHPAANQHAIDLRIFACGVIGLAFAAWLTWVKPVLKVKSDASR